MSHRLPVGDPCDGSLPKDDHPRHSSDGPLSAEEPNPRGQVEGVSWEADVPLVTNPLVLKQLALVATASGLFMGLLLTFISVTTGDFEAVPMMLLISLLAAAGLGVGFFLIALVFFGNLIHVRFTVDEEGVSWQAADRRARVMNRLAMVAGVLGGSPQAAGAGALAGSRENGLVRWSELSRVSCDPGHFMITLHSSWRPVGMLICPPEAWDQVLDYVRARVAPGPAAPQKGSRPLGRALLRTGLVLLAAAPLFTLSTYPFDLDLLLPLILMLFALATAWLIPLFGWVVMGCVAILIVQLTWIGLSEFPYLDGPEQVAFSLAYGGLAYLIWFSWRSVRGRVRPLLLEE